MTCSMESQNGPHGESFFRLYNNNPAFGYGGPFDVYAVSFEHACASLARGSQEFIRECAQERFSALCDEVGGMIVGSEELAVDEIEAELRAEFIAGLSLYAGEKE